MQERPQIKKNKRLTQLSTLNTCLYCQIIISNTNVKTKPFFRAFPLSL